jgi:hypothetical protein
MSWLSGRRVTVSRRSGGARRVVHAALPDPLACDPSRASQRAIRRLEPVASVSTPDDPKIAGGREEVGRDESAALIRWEDALGAGEPAEGVRAGRGGGDARRRDGLRRRALGRADGHRRCAPQLTVRNPGGPKHAGRLAGTRRISGVPCHRRAFEDEAVDWQIYIEDGPCSLHSRPWPGSAGCSSRWGWNSAASRTASGEVSTS